MKSKNKYELPFSKDADYIAITGGDTHSGFFKNAVDFILDYKIPVLAGLDGKVIDLGKDSVQGGFDKKYKDIKYQNYITLEHDGGEFSQYVHLAKDAITVKKGDYVKEGQMIASGIDLIGYVQVPHLHFIVFNGFEDDSESLEIQWKEGINVDVYSKDNIEQEIIKPAYVELVNLIIDAHKKLGITK